MCAGCSDARRCLHVTRMCAVVKTHLKSPLKDPRDRRDRRLGGAGIMCVLAYVSISLLDLGWILVDFIVISIDSRLVVDLGWM